MAVKIRKKKPDADFRLDKTRINSQHHRTKPGSKIDLVSQAGKLITDYNCMDN